MNVAYGMSVPLRHLQQSRVSDAMLMSPSFPGTVPLIGVSHYRDEMSDSSAVSMILSRCAAMSLRVNLYKRFISFFISVLIKWLTLRFGCIIYYNIHSCEIVIR